MREWFCKSRTGSDNEKIKMRLCMDEKMNFIDKKMKIKTGTGVVVNITCSYVEDKTLKELFLSYLERENATKLAA